MTNVAVIILIKDEILHIRRCLERLRNLNPKQIFVVDSPSTDGSDKVAAEMGATVVVHTYPGTQAAQFNWALDNLPINAEWILRLDADEYLTEETVGKIAQLFDCRDCPSKNGEVGYSLELKRKFMGREIRHATNGIRQVRIFRQGKGRYLETLMDERLEVGDWQKIDGAWKLVREGRTIDFDGAFYDDNLNGLGWWKEKHRSYAKREAVQAMNGTSQDVRKAAYYKLPRYVRTLMYFGLRYIVKLGFLDGVAGWEWNFWQGLWYRWIVDREIGRLKRCSM